MSTKRTQGKSREVHTANTQLEPTRVKSLWLVVRRELAQHFRPIQKFEDCSLDAPRDTAKIGEKYDRERCLMVAAHGYKQCYATEFPSAQSRD